MIFRLTHFLHMLGFAAFLGASFAQQRFMAASARANLAAAIRDRYEELAADLVTKAELPSLVLQVGTGFFTVWMAPQLLEQGWLHVKLGAIALLLVLSHLEMFNARRLVRARRQRGDAAATEIASRKKRHALMGTIGTVLVLVILGAVFFGRP